jgi:phospholipid transport system substrate-binding protein
VGTEVAEVHGMNTFTVRASLVLSLLMSTLLPVRVWAGPPTDLVRDTADRVSKILNDPALQGEAKGAERRAAIRGVADEAFDFEETAKRSLGRHWSARTPAEQKEFVQLFTNLLRRVYFSRVDRGTFDKVVFRGEKVQGDDASVITQLVLAPGSEMDLDYQLRRDGDRWKVYDLKIEGMSIVASYRAQFNRIIRTSSYETLIAKLKSNQAEFADAAK